MITVTLRLFFFGLVAFTPDEPSTNMRALLIDARHPPVASDGCPIHSHKPALFYSMVGRDSCRRPCREDRGLCRCDLEGGNLLDINPKEGEVCYRGHIDGSGSGSFQGDDVFDGVILKLRRLRPMSSRMNLRSTCNNPCPVGDNQKMCRLVAAQINFHPKNFYACRMAGQPPEVEKCPELLPRPLSSINFWLPGARQLAETVLFETEIKVNSKYTVDLEIAAFDGNGSYKINVPIVKYGKKYYAGLVIANYMEDVDHSNTYSRCDQNFIARDFELFHDLARQPLRPIDRPIPGAGENAPLEEFEFPIDAYECDMGILRAFNQNILRAGESRPICPQTAVGQ
jgi:hypothetical protein